MTSTITLSLTPRRAALLEGQATRLEILARLTAQAVQVDVTPMPGFPPPAPPRRPDLNLAIVLDRSGSMQGRPVHEAKRLAIRMAETLSPRDRVALVVYDHACDVLVPSAPGGDGARFRAALDGIEARGSTNLHGGWKAGARQVAPHATAERISRVLLLSDGHANQGLVDEQSICAEVATMAAAGVSTSTFGLGNSFNETLMGAVARAGQGGAHYGDTADDLAEPFDAELGLLNALVARQVRLRLHPAAGCTIDVLNDLSRDAGGIVLPDLADGAAVWALLALSVPAAHQGPVLTARASWRDASADCAGQSAPVLLDLPRLPAAAFAALAEDSDVAARVAEVEAAGIQVLARTAAYAGNWTEVERLIARAEALSAASPWLAAVVRELRALAAERDTPRFAKEAFYASRTMTSRATLADERGQAYEVSRERLAPSFLRRKTRQGKATKA